MARLRTLGAAHWSDTPIARLFSPMQEFVQRSAASGIVLFGATVLALVLANSGFAPAYNAVLNSYIGITVGPWALEETVLHWINDGLMAIFFFLVGLEIKREMSVGELRNLRAATLPIFAAVGGVVVPALIYTLLNFNGIGARGWGVPMATDIAFALGCLALLGDRVPFSLKIFLTAVAIVDDLIAVLVIALFYSGGLNVAALGFGFAVLGGLILLNLFGVRASAVYVALGTLVWLAFLQGGVHATIAGVLVAFTVPARNRIDVPTFVRRAHRIVHRLEAEDAPSARLITDEAQIDAVIELEDLCEQVQAPLQKIEHELHTWVQFGIMPIFALANAGVSFAGTSLAGDTAPVALGIVLGLVIGKTFGLFGATWLVVRLGLADLPHHVTWRHMVGVSVLGGVGFTMSLFIAALAFADAALLATAKVSILIASVIAATSGLLLLRQASPVVPAEQVERVVLEDTP